MILLQVIQFPATIQFYLTVLFLVSLGLLAWLRNSYRNYVGSLLIAIYNFNLFKELIHEEVGSLRSRSIIVCLNYLIIGSIFATLSFGVAVPSNNSGFWELLGISAGCILLFGIAKNALTAGLGFMLGFKELATGNIYLNYLFCNLTCLFLLPTVLCLAYLNVLPQTLIFKFGLVTIAFIFLARISVLFFHFFRLKGISLLHFILYLCSLEILPLVVIYNAFIDKIL